MTARAMSGFEARWMTVSVPCTGGDKRIEVGHVPPNDAEPTVSRVLIEMPFPTGREIVQDDHRFGCDLVQKSVDEVATDESGASHDANLGDGWDFVQRSLQPLPFRRFGAPARDG